MDSYLNSATDKANALKTELEKNGHTVEDVSVNGNKITITNYREKNKIVDISNGMIMEPPRPVEYSRLRVGDYVNYPVYYNNVGTWVKMSNGQANYGFPKDEYTGWRILSIDISNEEVKLISAGIPMSYYHYDNSYASVTNLTTNFFDTPINSTVTQYNFYQCGFKETQDSTSTIQNIIDLKALFTNNFTQIQEEVPKVHAMTKDELDGAKIAVNATYYKDNDLLIIPKKDNYSVSFWLATSNDIYSICHASTYDTYESVYGSNKDIRGIRPAVTLKTGIKFIESENKINNTTTYDIFE